jgi:ATP synthase H subunit
MQTESHFLSFFLIALTASSQRLLIRLEYWLFTSEASPVSRAEILVKVKDAESRAKDYITEAEEKSKAIVATARKESVRIIREAEEGIKVERDSTLAQEKVKIASQRKELMAKGEEEAEKLKVKAANNIPRARNYLKERFERTVDATSR